MEKFSVDFIGLSHYRRYFAMGTLGKNGIISKEKCSELLENHDILVHERYVGTTVYNAISTMISQELLDDSIMIFKKTYPDFSKDMDKVLKDRKHYSNNMFITDKIYFENYCEGYLII